MACGTIVGDGLPVGAGVAAIVAAETSGGIVVSKIIRVHAPGHTHVRENISQIDRRDFISGLLHEQAPRLIDLRIIGSIEIVKFVNDSLLAHIARRIINLQNLDRFFLDVGQRRADVVE